MDSSSDCVKREKAASIFMYARTYTCKHIHICISYIIQQNASFGCQKRSNVIDEGIRESL